MIKIQNSQQSTLNDFNQPQCDQNKVKQSKILPFQDQSIHAFYQVEVSQNESPVQESNNIDIETRLCRIQTSSKKYPRIVKEVDIKLSNGQLITLRDIFTTLPKTITCKSEQILVGSHSSYLTAPYQQPQYQQQQQQQYQEPEQEQQEESTLQHHEINHPKDIIESNHCHSSHSSSIFNKKLASEIELLQLKLNQLPLLPKQLIAGAHLAHGKQTLINKSSIPMPMPIRPTPTIAVAPKTEANINNNFTKINKTQQKQKVQQLQQLTEGEETGIEGGAAASSGSSPSNSFNFISNDFDRDCIIGGGRKNICGKGVVVKGNAVKGARGAKNGIFRVIRRNIRKEN